jgi:hypothetical protein
MGRFNTKVEPQPAPEKGRVCLFVDWDLYRRLRSVLILHNTNPSKFFAECAQRRLAEEMLGTFDAQQPPKKVKKAKRKPGVRRVKPRA